MKKYLITISAHESEAFGFRKELDTLIEVENFMKQFDGIQTVTFAQENVQGLMTKTTLAYVAGFHLTIELVDRGIF